MSELCLHADQLIAEGKLQESLDLCLSAFRGAEKGSEAERAVDPEVLWRTSRAYYLLAEEEEKQTKTNQAHYEEAFRLANIAMEVGAHIPAVHVWHGAALGGVVKFMPPKQQIAEAYNIRDRFAKALEIDATHGHAYQCWGAWCYEVSQIGWLSRQAATLLFGAPPSATMEEAEKYLLEAKKHQEEGPNYMYINGYLGMVYYKMGKIDESLRHFDDALAMPAKTQAQQRWKEKLTEKREKCAKKK